MNRRPTGGQPTYQVFGSGCHNSGAMRRAAFSRWMHVVHIAAVASALRDLAVFEDGLNLLEVEA